MRIKNIKSKFSWWQIAVIVISLLISSSFLPSCNIFSSITTIRFAVQQPENKQWDEVVNEFNQSPEHSRIKIELASPNDFSMRSSNELRRFYVDSFKPKSDKSSMDIIYTDIAWLPEFAEKGWLKPLDMEKEFLKEFLLSEVEKGKYKGQLYRIPLRTDAGLLFYRKDLLKKIGISKIETFDDLKKAAQRLQKELKVPFGYLWQGKSNNEGLSAMFIEVLHGHGGFWINEDGLVGLNRPEAIKAINFLRSLIATGVSQGVTDYDDEEVRRKFRNGDVALVRNWPSMWVNANLTGSQASGKVGIQPMVHIKGQISAVCRGGWGFAIAQKSKHQSEALEVIKFLTSTKIQRQLSMKSGFIPSRINLFDDPQLVEKYSFLPELKKTIEENGVFRPQIPEYAEASCILQKGISAVLRKENPKSAESAMKKATQETRNLLAGGKSNCLSLSK